MDFNQFDGPTAAEKGGRLHLRNPTNGELIGEGKKAAVVIVRGTESPSFQDAVKGLNSDLMKAKETEDKATLAEIHASMVDRARHLVVGFENISNGKAALTSSEADIRWFLNLQTIGAMKNGEAPTFIEQVAEFARDRGNYLGNG